MKQSYHKAIQSFFIRPNPVHKAHVVEAFAQCHMPPVYPVAGSIPIRPHNFNLPDPAIASPERLPGTPRARPRSHPHRRLTRPHPLLNGTDTVSRLFTITQPILYK